MHADIIITEPNKGEKEIISWAEDLNCSLSGRQCFA